MLTALVNALKDETCFEQVDLFADGCDGFSRGSQIGQSCEFELLRAVVIALALYASTTCAGSPVCCEFKHPTVAKASRVSCSNLHQQAARIHSLPPPPAARGGCSLPAEEALHQHWPGTHL